MVSYLYDRIKMKPLNKTLLKKWVFIKQLKEAGFI